VKLFKHTVASHVSLASRHLGSRLLVAGLGALTTQLAAHNPLLALAVGLGALAVAALVDRWLLGRPAGAGPVAVPA
jgi:hypothetical protein